MSIEGFEKKLFLAFLSCSLLFFNGCFDFSGKLKQKRSELITEQHNLKDEIRRNITLLDHKDRLRQEISQHQKKLELYREHKIRMLKEREL